MTVFLLTLLPVVFHAMWLIIELCRQRKYAMLGMAVLFAAATSYYFVFIAHVIVTGEKLFPYSGYINRFISVMLMPSFYWLANTIMGHRPKKSQLIITYIPAVIMFFINLVPYQAVPGLQPGNHLVYYPNVSIGISGMTIGWSIAELFLVCQGMVLIVKTLNDYYTHGDANHRTDTSNELIIAYGNIGLALFIQAFVGCSNWRTIPDYAIADFCFNSYVFSYGLNLLRKSVREHRYMGYDAEELTKAYAMINIEADNEKTIVNEQKMPIPSIDYAVSPEIPREEEQASIAQESKAEEMSAKDMLVEQLRTLIEQEKIYLQAGIRIDEVALTLGTNRTYMAKMMKTVYGHTFSEYMNICRLNSARADMLQRKDASIETIALANGFNSSNTFNKVFNQHFGSSPAAWRRKMIE